MKGKIALTVIVLVVTMPAWAGLTNGTIPEPSTLALFASVAIVLVLARKFRK